MRKSSFTIACLAVLLGLWVPGSAQALPKGFFGIVPQTGLTEADTQYMSAGGIESIRVPVAWSGIQPTAYSGYDWTSLDQTVAVSARAHMEVLPFLVGTPSWLEGRETTLPISDATERRVWTAFVRAAVERYEPNGVFWREHGPFSADPVPADPIRSWQIWNEANFFYFAYPVSPERYAKLLEITSPVIRSIDPGAHILLSGLFGKPDQGGSKGMSAVRFLARLYEVPGIRADFDGVALHPYAFNASSLEHMVQGMHSVIAANHDHADLYITEVGWGSQDDPRVVAFEQGPAGQARELTRAYRYLIANQARLSLHGVYWFSWKDLSGSCSFCDSTGLFREGAAFEPKPAWAAFVRLTGGRLRPAS